MGVGANIDRILREKNISVAELSRIADVPSGTLYAAIKRDTKNMDSARISRIAEALNVSVSEIDYSMPRELHGDLRKHMTEYRGDDMFNALNALLRDNGYVFYESDWPDENDYIIGWNNTYKISKEAMTMFSRSISDMFKSMLQFIINNADSVPTQAPEDIEDLADLYSYYEELHKNLDREDRR